MQALDVVDFQKGIDDQLPVRRPPNSMLAEEAVLADAECRQLPIERTEVARNIKFVSRRRIQQRPDQAVMHRARQSAQTARGSIERRKCLPPWHRRKRTREVIRPAMITAGQAGPFANRGILIEETR